MILLIFFWLKVTNARNDCVDVSGGNYFIKNAHLYNCGDKSISVGEASNVDIDFASIVKTSIGVASKDSSIVKISNSIIENDSICLSAYNKKKEFWGGLILYKNLVCSGKIHHDNISAVYQYNETY